MTIVMGSVVLEEKKGKTFPIVSTTASFFSLSLLFSLYYLVNVDKVRRLREREAHVVVARLWVVVVVFGMSPT